jgi:uncharacterized membrane protein YedE/YeeE
MLQWLIRFRRAVRLHPAYLELRDVVFAWLNWFGSTACLAGVVFGLGRRLAGLGASGTLALVGTLAVFGYWQWRSTRRLRKALKAFGSAVRSAQPY